jgi:threonine/homoserine/homoserine lactone efflux protein
VHLSIPWAYLSLVLVFAGTPGATTALVVRYTLDGGRRRGMTASMGAMTANLLQAGFAMLGVGALVERWPLGLVFVRAAGALFLAWIGARSIWHAIQGRQAAAELAKAGAASPHHPYREGLAVNILNPSITTFYIGVAPSFLPAHAEWPDLALLLLTHVVIAVGCHFVWASIFHRARAIFTHDRPRRWLDAVSGIVLIGLALKILLARNLH